MFSLVSGEGQLGHFLLELFQSLANMDATQVALSDAKAGLPKIAEKDKESDVGVILSVSGPGTQKSGLFSAGGLQKTGRFRRLSQPQILL